MANDSSIDRGMTFYYLTFNYIYKEKKNSAASVLL